MAGSFPRGQSQAIHGQVKSRLSPVRRVPTGEAAGPNLGLRTCPDERAPVRQDATPRPRGSTSGPRRPGRGRAVHRAGRSERVFIVGRVGGDRVETPGRASRWSHCGWQDTGGLSGGQARGVLQSPPGDPGPGGSGVQEAVEGVVGRLQVEEHLAHLGIVQLVGGRHAAQGLQPGGAQR